MAITYMQPSGLPQWPLGSDVPTRDEFNAAFAQLNGRGARYAVGVESARVSEGDGGGGLFYYSTDTGVMWFFDGTDEASWRVVGHTILGKLTLLSDSYSSGSLEIHDANGNVVLILDPLGGISRPGRDNLNPLTLPSGLTPYGGSAATPGYYLSADRLVVVQGSLNTPAAGSYTITGLPRPRDLGVHQWPIMSVGSGQTVTGFGVANLYGPNGSLTLSGMTGFLTALDSISYYAE